MKSYIIYNSPDIGTLYYAESALKDALANGFDAELFDGVWKTDSKKFCEDHEIILDRKWLEQSNWYKRVNPKKWLKNFSTTSVMGCFASHFLLWKKCIEYNKAICIFEYDVLIKRPLPDGILDKFDEAIEICRTPQHDLPPYDEVVEDKEFADFNIIDFPRPGFPRGNSTGYIIKPAGAKKMIKRSKEYGYLPADTMLNREWLDYKKLIPGIASKALDYSTINPSKAKRTEEIRKKIEIERTKK